MLHVQINFAFANLIKIILQNIILASARDSEVAKYVYLIQKPQFHVKTQTKIFYLDNRAQNAMAILVEFGV